MLVVALLMGGLLARPALGQQQSRATGKTVTEIARTTDDLRERILLDKIEELEKRLSDLEERSASSESAANPAPASPDAPASAPVAQAQTTSPTAAAATP